MLYLLSESVHNFQAILSSHRRFSLKKFAEGSI